MAVLPLPWLPGSQHRAHEQTQVESANVNQQALEYILLPSQMRSSHPTRLVAVREASFHEFASFP